MRPSSGYLVALLAFAAFIRTAIAGYLLDAELIPDTELYAQGSLGLYPSPIGRLVGVLGEGGLVLCSSLAAAAVVCLTAAVAHSYGRSVVLPATLALLVPASLWLIFPGVDALAVAFLLAAVLYRERPQLATLLLVLAAATHLAVVPVVVVLAYVLIHPLIAYALTLLLAFASALTVCLTPYALSVALDPRSLGYGAASVALALSVSLPLAYRLRSSPLLPHVLCASAGAVAAVVLVQADDPGTYTRYALPVLFLYAAAVGGPRKDANPWATSTST